MKRCMQIFFTSSPVRAYLSLFLRKMIRERHSLSLWGPVDGREANTPVSLSSIQCFGAATHFRCFLGPQAMAALGTKKAECWVLSKLFHSPLSLSSRGSLVPLCSLPSGWCHLHIWGYWYFSWQIWIHVPDFYFDNLGTEWWLGSKGPHILESLEDFK